MTPDAVTALVAMLPKAQQIVGRRKIETALAMGWRSVQLPTPEGETPHHVELMGFHPARGEPTLLPEVEG